MTAKDAHEQPARSGSAVSLDNLRPTFVRILRKTSFGLSFFFTYFKSLSVIIIVEQIKTQQQKGKTPWEKF